MGGGGGVRYKPGIKPIFFFVLSVLLFASCEDPTKPETKPDATYYTVTFNAIYGSAVKSQTVLPGAQAVRPADPGKTGFDFGGWYKEAACTTPWDFEADTVTANITLYAKWNAVGSTTYTVTFNADGGSPAPVQQVVSSGGTASQPQAMAKNGYTFDAWYKESTFANKWNFGMDTVTANITLHAKWNAAGSTTYTVNFNADGGSPAPVQQVVSSGGTASQPQVMLKNGYTFDAWYKESTFANKWNFGTDTVTANITLHAKWNVVVQTTYTVDFVADGGSPAPGQQVVASGGKASPPPAMTKSGYNFDAWYKENTFTNKWNFSTNTVTENITLHAKWNLIPGTPTYTVTFHSNGGTAVPVQTVPQNGKASRPDSTRVGQLVEGWYLDNDTFKKRWNFENDFVSENTDLYANWVAAYTVTFNANGGDPAPAQQIVATGNTATAPPVMSKTGYTFGGWYREEWFYSQWNFASSTVTANTTLYAKWNINQYTVMFSADGGSVTPTQRTVSHGSVVVEPSVSKTGYTFGGWYKEATLENLWNFASDTVTANMVLYAKWTINQYTVTFNADDGTPAPASPITVNYGTRLDTPPAMTKEGYNFDAWYTSSSFATKWNFASSTVTADTTLYAKWLPLYTVTFNADDGTPAPQAQTILTGGKATEPPAMTKGGYVFDAWYTSSSFATKWNFASSTVTANTTLWAKWLPLYTVTFNIDGGMPVLQSQTIITGGKLIEPPSMTKEGYAFGGWYRENTFETTWNFVNDTVTDNTNLYVRWVAVDISDFPNGAFIYAFTVSTTAEWNAAVTAIKNSGNNKNYVIAVTENFSVAGTSVTTFGNVTGITVVIQKTGATNRQLNLSSNGYLLNINTSQNVILREIALKGSMSNNTSLVYVRGILDMKGSATVSGNTYSSTSPPHSSSGGGGVYVAGGTFTMRDNAVVSNNTHTASVSTSGGGGVYVESGTFTMQDNATVSNNTNSSLSGTGGGGGVYVESGTFTMQDNATVSDNTNSAMSVSGGGGVYVASGTFIMQGRSSVSDNANSVSSGGGGGVHISGRTGNNTTFIMRDSAMVSGNTSSSTNSSSGGGVYVYSYAVFTMQDNAAVSGNTSSAYYNYGGGVYVEFGTFRIAGGTVYGYVVDDSNSNVCKDSAGAVLNNHGAALYKDNSSLTVAQYGSFTGDTWSGTDIPIYGTETTIKVVNGVLQ